MKDVRTVGAAGSLNDTLLAMDWTAPPVERPGGSMTAPESVLLPGLLSWHRTTLLAKCTGLTAVQLAERSVSPSNLSLLGLLRHLRKVERVWFRTRVAQEPVAALHGFGSSVDIDFERIDPATAATDYDAFVAEIRAADAAAWRARPRRGVRRRHGPVLSALRVSAPHRGVRPAQRAR